MSKSGVQLEVIRLFRGFMKEVRRKTPETREQFRQVIYARFYQDAKIPKYDAYLHGPSFLLPQFPAAYTLLNGARWDGKLAHAFVSFFPSSQYFPANSSLFM